MPKDAAVQGSSFQRSVRLSPGSVSSSHPQNLHHPALASSLNILKQSYFSGKSYSQRTVGQNNLSLLRLKLNASDWLSWFLLGGSRVCAGRVPDTQPLEFFLAEYLQALSLGLSAG